MNRTRGPRPLLFAGIILLLVWAGWWGGSVLAKPMPRLLSGAPDHPDHGITYLVIWPFLGLDFQHNYAAVNAWLEGGNPYVHIRWDPMNQYYIYPPLTLLAFTWAGLFPPAHASLHLTVPAFNGEITFPICFPPIFIWMAVITLIVAGAAWQSWRVRRRLALPDLPLPFVLAAALLSYPVIFETERGNCNVLPLLAITLLIPGLAHRYRLLGDLGVALCAAFAAGIKPYAVVLLLGLLALRRFRAAAFAAGLLAMQVGLLHSMFALWLGIARDASSFRVTNYLDSSHSLPAHWNLIWRDLGLPALARVPPLVVVGSLVLAVVLAVSWRVFRARPTAAVAWPYLLWLTTMATLTSTVAHDYNLLFLPLAVLAAWDHRDPWWAQLCLLPMALWWQPLYLGITGLPWLILKVAGILLVGVVIVRRLQPAPASEGRNDPAIRRVSPPAPRKA